MDGCRQGMSWSSWLHYATRIIKVGITLWGSFRIHILSMFAFTLTLSKALPASHKNVILFSADHGGRVDIGWCHIMQSNLSPFFQRPVIVNQSSIHKTWSISKEWWCHTFPLQLNVPLLSLDVRAKLPN